jgi:hypothetical protein
MMRLTSSSALGFGLGVVAMEPVFQIPLTDSQLKQMGEIAATLSLIERLMQNTVSYLLAVPAEVAGKILGSTATDAYSSTWLAIVAAKCRDENVVKQARNAIKEFARLTKEWNEFHHSVYALQHDVVINGEKVSLFTFGKGGPTEGKSVGIKVKTNTLHDPALIPVTREFAAKLSHTVNRICEVAHAQSLAQP